MDQARPWQDLLDEAPNVVVFDAQGRVLAAGSQARQRLAGLDESAPWWGLEPPPRQASVTREHLIGPKRARILWKRLAGDDGCIAAAVL